MSGEIKIMVERLREESPVGWGNTLQLMRDAADLIEQQAARIAELEARSAEPVVWFGPNNYCTMNREIAERFNLRSAYAAPVADSAMAKDAERYRWLRDTLHGAKAGGGVEVNDALQVYQETVPGEEVRIYWYLHTPVGFHEITAGTLDEAVDEGIAASEPKKD